ncbi:hypothetical protein FHG87_009894 [Trinorchestia longiramus]|nr:hypothetical protein FHG87_009894 [Trinorchestia longiramus]
MWLLRNRQKSSGKRLLQRLRQVYDERPSDYPHHSNDIAPSNSCTMASFMNLSLILMVVMMMVMGAIASPAPEPFPVPGGKGGGGKGGGGKGGGGKGKH